MNISQGGDEFFEHGALFPAARFSYADPMYRATTHGIEVTVRPEFMESESAPEKGRWFWSYTVLIANHSDVTMQLVSRFWQITNALGEVSEVEGLGVIGEQPTLTPGDSFQYTSGCPLTTSSGTMVGHYVMRGDDDACIVAQIPPFSLDLPNVARVIN